MQPEDLVQILIQPINYKKEIMRQLGKFKYELKLDDTISVRNAHFSYVIKK